MNKPFTSTPALVPSLTTLLGGLPAGTDVHRPMRWYSAVESLEPQLRIHDPVRVKGVPLFRRWLRRQNRDFSLHEIAHAWTHFVQLAKADLNTLTFLSVWERFYLLPQLFQAPLPKRMGFWVGTIISVLVFTMLMIPIAMPIGGFLGYLADLLKVLIRPDLAQ